MCEQCLKDFDDAYLIRARSKLRGGRGRGSLRRKVLILAVIKNHFLDVWFTSKDVDEVLAAIGIDKKSYAILADMGSSKVLESNKFYTRASYRFYKLYCVNETTYKLFDRLWDFKAFRKITGYTENAMEVVREAQKCEQNQEKFRKMRDYAAEKVRNGESIKPSDLVEKFNVRPVEAGLVLRWMKR